MANRTPGVGATRVYLVDPHPAILWGLRGFLDEPDIEIVGEARSGTKAVREILLLAPRVVLLAIRLPDLDGREVMRRIKEGTPETAVIFFTDFDDPSCLMGGILGGAAGFLLKTATPEEVLALVRSVARGEDGLPREYWESLFRERQTKEAARNATARAGWSDREIQILYGMAGGLTNDGVAKKLRLHPDTVRFHLKKIFRHLGVGGRTQAVAHAIGMGLIVPPNVAPGGSKPNGA